MRTHPLRPNLALILGCLLALLLFFLGLAGAGSHLWGRYLLPILVAFLWGRRRDIYIVAALASVLVAAEYWTGDRSPNDLLINHLLPILILWGAAWLLARRHTALQASEQRFAKVFGANPGGIAITRQVDGRFLEANDAYLAMVGCTREQLIGRTSRDLGILTAEQRDQIRAAILEDGFVHGLDVQIHNAQGQVVDASYSVEQMEFGGDRCFLILAIDMTERTRLEEAAGRLAAIVASSSDAIVSTDLQGRVVSWNRSAEQLYECSESAAMGRPISELLPTGHDTDETEIVARIRGGAAVPVADRIWTKADGTKVDLSVILSPVIDRNGKVIGAASLARDITARKQMEEALAASERKYRDLYDNSPDMYFVGVPAQGLILDCNQTLALTLGYTPAELIGGPSSTLFDAASYTQMQKDSNELLAAGRDDNYEIRLRRRDGTMLDAIMSVTLEHDPAGGPARARVTLHDITERKRLEVELRHSEQKWRSVFEFLPVGLSVVDGKDKVTYSNPALAQILGLPPDGILNGRYAQRRYFHADMRPMAANEFPSQQALREGQVVRDVVIGIEKEDGELIWVSVSATPESIDGLALTATVDITVRKRMEDALAASERKFRDLYDNSPDMYVSGYSNGFFRDCNLTAARVLGFTPDELMSQPTSTIFTPASYSRVVAELPKHLAAEAWDNFEVQLQCKDGTVLDALLSAQFEPATADHLAYSRVTLHDITERKCAEQALRESQARYQMLADHATDVIWSMDPAYKVTYVSPSVLRQSGFTPEETIGRTLEQTFAPGSRAAARATVGEIYRLIQTGQPVPATPNLFEMLRKDGTTYWGENIYGAVYNAQGEFQQLVGATREVTKRVHAEAQLHETYQRLQLATDAAGIGIWNWNFADGRLDWDDRMCELYAITDAERAIGISYDLWRTRVHPDDLALVEPTQGDPNRLGGAFAQTYRILLPDGAVRYIQASSVMEYTADGKPRRMVGVNRDVTDQMQYERLLQDTNAVLEEHVAVRTAELQAALAELQRAGKLKDEFMAMISHELRTPLTGVLSMSELLEDQIAGPLNDRQNYYVKGIIQSGERLLNVINGILSYTHLLSGKVELQVESCELANLLDICAVSQQYKAAAKSQVIAVQVAPPELTISADATALAEVLKRLLDNAVKFTPDGGQIGLEAHPGAASHAVDLVVWDTGIGIAADQLDNIFHVFIQADARLARSHEGIGIGLAYVDEMVRLMGGSIAVASTPGKGSRFTVTLPEARW